MRKANKPGEPSRRGVTREERPGFAVWRVASLDAARAVLRARRATVQAGFTAEWIPRFGLRHRPVLISDGPLHDEQRREVARYFAPTVVEGYREQMAACAARLLDEAAARGGVALDEYALYYTVEVTAAVVGLTASPVRPMARRLTAFFRQPPLDITLPDLGRTPRQWARAAGAALTPIARFYLADVRPAVRARRREPRGDVISHLIAQGYTDADIAVECVTYGTAGMVTTREFITMAAWHLLTDEPLRERYLAADRAGRIGVLHEIIRLEPVVGHLYRRAVEPLTIEHAGGTHAVAPGDLLDVDVRAVNLDPAVVGEDGEAVRPGRPLPAGVNAAGMTFGDGAHRCPGQPLAMLESEIWLTDLLGRRPRIVREPDVEWDDLIEGYQLRGLELAFGE